MVKLKDLFEYDLDMFFNPDEFGEDHTVNGENYTVVIDQEKLKELQAKDVDGIYRVEVLFSIKKSDLPGKPAGGKSMTFDKKRYTILSCIEDEVTYNITLGANRS